MFNFLKEKLKGAFEKITKKVEAPVEEKKEEPKIEKPVEEKVEIKEKKKEEKIEEKVEDKKSLFGKLKEKITTTSVSEEKFNDLFWDLELVLLENNVAVEVIEKIKSDLKGKIVDKPVKRGEIVSIIRNSLKETILNLFDVVHVNVIEEIKKKKEEPYVIVFFGVNGVGKTSVISKFAKLCQRNNLKVVFGAGDSFRKGAIEQLEEWGRRLDVKVIKHQYGSDPAAICFDTVKFAKSHNVDVVLLDTAGRLHSNQNLMMEMEKIIRVVKPNLKVFVTESLIGNDAIEQSKLFNESIGIDGIVLTKTDVDEKGGTLVSIEYVTKKPILYLSSGQEPDDLKEFNKTEVIANLGL